MSPTTKSVLASLLAAALAVVGALYAQRLLRENQARARAAQPMSAPAAPAGAPSVNVPVSTQAVDAPAPPPAQAR